MAAHRTWGVFFSSAATSYTQLTEVAFLNAAGSEVSIGGEVFASSEYGAGYEAARAFDKNTGTDWCTASGDVDRRLWYVHPAAVDVAKLRIRCSNSPYIPQSVAEVRVRWSDTMGSAWSEYAHRLSVESGSFAAGATVVMNLLPPLVLTPLPPPMRLEQNLLHPHARSVGVISDRVMFKATPTAPESPFALGRVWLLRLADGYKAWEGWSDVNGYYTATGLELGVEYIAVGIDPYRTHKATGAGPVTAMEAAP